MGTSAVLPRESPTAVIHHFLLVLLRGSGPDSRNASLVNTSATHRLREQSIYCVTANFRL